MTEIQQKHFIKISSPFRFFVAVTLYALLACVIHFTSFFFEYFGLSIKVPIMYGIQQIIEKLILILGIISLSLILLVNAKFLFEIIPHKAWIDPNENKTTIPGRKNKLLEFLDNYFYPAESDFLYRTSINIILFFVIAFVALGLHHFILWLKTDQQVGIVIEYGLKLVETLLFVGDVLWFVFHLLSETIKLISNKIQPLKPLIQPYLNRFTPPPFRSKDSEDSEK